MHNLFKCRYISCNKVEFDSTLSNSGYKNIDFKYNLENKNNNRRSRQRHKIWLNAPFSQIVSKNVAKRLLDLLGKHFLPNNQLRKIFRRNLVKVGYSCTPSLGSIIKSHNKKLINDENKQTKE